MPRKSKKPVRKQTQSPTGEVVGQVGQILLPMIAGIAATKADLTDVLCDLLRVFPAQSLSDRLSRFLPGVDPIRPPHNGLPLALMRYLQILPRSPTLDDGADGPHLFEDSLPLFFQSSRSIHKIASCCCIYTTILRPKRSISTNPLL